MRIDHSEFQKLCNKWFVCTLLGPPFVPFSLPLKGNTWKRRRKWKKQKMKKRRKKRAEKEREKGEPWVLCKVFDAMHCNGFYTRKKKKRGEKKQKERKRRGKERGKREK